VEGGVSAGGKDPEVLSLLVQGAKADTVAIEGGAKVRIGV
jgi:hypothetical protein